MSHNLDTHGDKAAFFTSSREGWWHRLGVNTEKCLTAEDALRTAHLDYEVTKQPLQSVVVTDSGVTTVDVPGKFATVRPNPFTGELEALGVVGATYTVVQNRDNTTFLDELVGQSGAHYETAGALDGGRKTFVSMKAPQGMLIGGHDAVDKYLVATNSHDGSSAFTVMATPIRVVCQNTLTAALGAATAKVSIRHTTNVLANVKAAQHTLNVMWDYMAAFEHTATRLYDEKLTRAEFDRIVAAAFPEDKEPTKRATTIRDERIAKVTDLYTTAETQEGIRGTAWGAYNALTEWADWFMPVRSGGEDARAERIASGGAVADFKAKALALVTR